MSSFDIRKEATLAHATGALRQIYGDSSAQLEARERSHRRNSQRAFLWLVKYRSFSGLFPLDRNFLLVLVPIRDLRTFPSPPSRRVRSCPSRFLFCACRFEPFSFPLKLKCVRTFLLILRLNEAPFNPFRNFLELCTSQAGLCAVTKEPASDVEEGRQRQQ